MSIKDSTNVHLFSSCRVFHVWCLWRWPLTSRIKWSQQRWILTWWRTRGIRSCSVAEAGCWRSLRGSLLVSRYVRTCLEPRCAPSFSHRAVSRSTCRSLTCTPAGDPASSAASTCSPNSPAINQPAFNSVSQPPSIIGKQNEEQKQQEMSSDFYFTAWHNASMWVDVEIKE